jgi:NADH-quinone oxidoreductase subunit H
MAVTLFFGGWDGPVFGVLPWLWPLVWFTVKTSLFVYLFVWLRGSLPRLRYDRLMWLGWKRLIPAALVWIMVTAAFNTAELSRQVRMGVFAAVMVLVLVWVGRGDPRLRSLAESRARSVTRGKAVSRGPA